MLDVVSVVVRLVACDVVRDEVTEVAGVVAWSHPPAAGSQRNASEPFRLNHACVDSAVATCSAQSW